MEQSVDTIPTKETEPRTLFDAFLVHGYWLSQKGEGGIVRPSLRSHLEARAASIAYHKVGGDTKIILTTGHIWGSDYPSVADVMKEELVRKYKVPKEDIFVKTTFINKEGKEQEVKTTDEEIEAFLQFAKENGWTKLADIAAKTHYTTIPLLYKRRGQEIKMDAAEDILKNDDDRIKSLVNRFGASKYEWSFRLYEGVKRLVIMLEPDYELLGKSAGKRRSKKNPLGLPILSTIVPVDKYKT